MDDRSLFIEMLVAELQRQKDEGTFTSLAAPTPTQIYRKMCYDFPLVSVEELTILGDAIEALVSYGMNGSSNTASETISVSTSSKSSKEDKTQSKSEPISPANLQRFKNKFSLNHTFMENLIILSDKSPIRDQEDSDDEDGADNVKEVEMNFSTQVETKSSSAVTGTATVPPLPASNEPLITKEETVGKINAAIFLKLPLYLLESNQAEISHLFNDMSFDPLSESNDDDVGNDDRPQQGHHELLSMHDICRRFHTLMLRGSVSLISPAGAEYLKRGEHLTLLGRAIDVLRPNHPQILNNSLELVNRKGVSDITLSQHIHNVIFVTNKEEEEREDEEGKEAEKGNGNGKGEGEGEGETEGDVTEEMTEEERLKKLRSKENQEICDWCKDIWIHLVFLARDLMAHFPELIASSLPGLTSCLLAGTPAISNEASNLFSFSRAPINSFPTSSECLFVLVISSLASSLCEETHSRQSAMSAEEQLARRKQFQAMVALKGILNDKLAVLGSICERMVRYSGDNGTEAASLLCNIIRLYLIHSPTDEGADVQYNAINVSGSTILQPSRIVQEAHEKLISSRFVSLVVQCWVDLAAQGKQNGEQMGASHREANGAQTASVRTRLSDLISRMCLQCVTTGRFIMNLPSFFSSVMNTASTWESKEAVASTNLTAEELLPLLLGLVAATDGNPQATQVHQRLQSVLQLCLAEIVSGLKVLSTPDANSRLIPSTACPNAEDGSSDKVQSTPSAVLSPRRYPHYATLTRSLYSITSPQVGKMMLLAICRSHPSIADSLKRWIIELLDVDRTNPLSVKPEEDNNNTSSSTSVNGEILDDSDNVHMHSGNNKDDRQREIREVKRLAKSLRSLIELQGGNKTD